MTPRPVELQAAPWGIAPVPSKMGCRMSAMRNARRGPLRGEAIDDAGHDFLRQACAQLRQSRIEGCFASDLRMRSRQKALGLLAILPDVFGSGDDPRKPLGPFAFSGT